MNKTNFNNENSNVILGLDPSIHPTGFQRPHCVQYTQTGRTTSTLSFSHLLRESINWISGTSPNMTRYGCERGRSMVEMLGVLAVMGVLSVGGVAMYTSAMNKYKANELLNESSKRAVIVATQLLTGKSISNEMINEFNNNGTPFTGVEAVGTTQFKLTLSGVDSAVCTQLKATVGSNTIIQEVGENCSYLTFNNDLSKGAPSGGVGGGSEPETPADPCAGITCQNGGTCSAGLCDCAGTGYTGDTCETQIYYTCSVGKVYDSNNNFIKNCPQGCASATSNNLDNICVSGWAPE